MSVNRKTSQGKEIVAGLYPDTHVRLLNLGETNITNLQDGQDLLYDGTQWINCFARVVVNYEDSFKGQTLEVYEESDPLDVVTTTLPTNANQITLYLRQSGHYHFSCTISGETYEDMADVGIAGNVYSVFLSTAETIEVTIYSATGDTLTYIDADGVQKTAVFDTDSSSKLVTLSIISSGIPITFTSTIALDPNDCISEDAESSKGKLLGSYYSKTITVTSQTTEIYVMPDGALYWYGWMKPNEFEKMTPENGWTWKSSGGSLGVAYWDKNVMLHNHTSSDPNRDSTKTIGTSTTNKKTGLSSVYIVDSSGGWNGRITLFTSKNVYDINTATDKLAEKTIHNVSGKGKTTFDLSPYISDNYYLAFVGYASGYDINVWAVVVTEAE